MKKTLLLLLLAAMNIMTHAQTWTIPAVSVGDILCEDGSVAKLDDYLLSHESPALGVVFYADYETGQGWAVNLQFSGWGLMWGNRGYDIPELPNYTDGRTAITDFDGYTNTQIIRNTGDAEMYPAAWSVDYDNGWYMPAMGQLRILCTNLLEVNASLWAIGGEPFSSENKWFAQASTEADEDWGLLLNSRFTVTRCVKDVINEFYCVRSIRTFEFEPIERPFHLGDLITNDDGSQGIVYQMDKDGGGGWMAALEDKPECPWGEYNVNVPELHDFPYRSQYLGMKLLIDGDGTENTRKLREFQDPEAGFAASQVDFEHGWILPTATQLCQLYTALPFIEEPLANAGGDSLGRCYYWSSNELNDEAAWAVIFGHGSDYYHGDPDDFPKTYTWTKVREVRHFSVEGALNVGFLSFPPPICDEGSLELTPPEVHNAIEQGWQISSSYDFSNPIAYTDQILDDSYDSWLIRFWASDGTQVSYSNVSIIRVGHPEESERYETACGSYLWNGTVYTESGDYTMVIPSTYYDCDHTITLHLTIYPYPALSGIQGMTEVVLDPDDPNLTLHYSVEVSDPEDSIRWELSNPDWELNVGDDPTVCEITFHTAGTGTLTVYAENDCGVVDRRLDISSEVEAVVEHGSSDWIIYPNPTDGVLFVETHGRASLSNQTYRITNLMGQTLLTGQITADNQQINVSSLPQGMYFITFANVTRKFVVR